MFPRTHPRTPANGKGKAESPLSPGPVADCGERDVANGHQPQYMYVFRRGPANAATCQTVIEAPGLLTLAVIDQWDGELTDTLDSGADDRAFR